MKALTTTLWISLLAATLTSLSASEQISIDQQITAMQNASPHERVKLMNQFKQQLASMNAQERSKSITRLREQMKAEGEHVNDHVDKKENHTEAQRDQMQQSEHLQRMEQMQQRHGGDQQMHEMKQEMDDISNQLPHPSQLH
jgi:hypothetical protein